MPDQSCSVGDAQLQVVEVLRDQNPEWVTESAPTQPQRRRTAEQLSVGEMLLGVKPALFALWTCCGWTMVCRHTPERPAARKAASDVADAPNRGVFFGALFLMLLTALLLFVGRVITRPNG